MVGFHSGKNQCSLVCVAASEPFSVSVSYFVERKQKETRLDMKFAAVAAESAARNERLVQVSNKRITSFVGFQKISGCVSAPSGSPREPRPFADGGGRSNPSIRGGDICSVRTKTNLQPHSYGKFDLNIWARR